MIADSELEYQIKFKGTHLMVLTGMTVVNPEGISSVIEERGCIMHACTHHDAGDPHVSKVADVWVPVCRHA